MGTGHRHMIWLTTQSQGETDDALLVSALCGDQLRAPGRAWLRPSGVSRGEGVMLLGYEGVGGGGIAFCVVATPDLSPSWVQSLRGELTPEGAERRWGPFVGLFGRNCFTATSASPAWLETAIAHDGAIWGARRALHPSAAIDCLSRRDRIDAEQRLRAAFARSMGQARRDNALATPSGAPP